MVVNTRYQAMFFEDLCTQKKRCRFLYTSSTAQGVGGSFTIGNLQERLVVVNHGWQSELMMDRKVVGASGYRSVPLSIQLSSYLSLQLSIYLSSYLSNYLSIYLSSYLDLQPSRSLAFQLSSFLAIQLSSYLAIYLYIYHYLSILVELLVS